MPMGEPPIQEGRAHLLLGLFQGHGPRRRHSVFFGCFWTAPHLGEVESPVLKEKPGWPVVWQLVSGGPFAPARWAREEDAQSEGVFILMLVSTVGHMIWVESMESTLFSFAPSILIKVEVKKKKESLQLNRTKKTTGRLRAWVSAGTGRGNACPCTLMSHTSFLFPGQDFPLSSAGLWEFWQR